jgi:2-amino-4-hydroxy-6-hydroxymethyldihydropteridine diphosphokinase
MPNHFHWVVFVHQNEIKIISNSTHTSTSRNSITTTKSATKTKDKSHTIARSDRMTKTRTINYAIGILLRSYTRAIQNQLNFSGSLFQQHTQAKPLIDKIEITPAYWNTAFGTQINIAEGKSYLETCIEYIHKNPVYSGLVGEAEDWEYSSFQDYLGIRDGKLIDYELISKEGLFPQTGHTTTSRRSMTTKTKTKDESHTITRSNSMKDESHTITRNNSMTTHNICIIGIGSNINAKANIPKMLEILKTKVTVLKVSAFLKTKPIGILNQPDFTNGAVKIQTILDLKNLNKLLKEIEDQLGRVRTGPKYGPRCIDLDIVVWNGEIVDKDYYTRDFLQKSVAELTQ